MRRLILAVASMMALGACATEGGFNTGTSGAGWVGAWGASPAPPGPDSQSFDNQTIRQTLIVSAAGSEVRIRFTNEYGDKPLKIGAATISRTGPDGKLTGAPTAILFGGQTGATLPKASPMFSDNIPFRVSALEKISISLFFPEPTGPCTCHTLGMENVEISNLGDFTRAGFSLKETTTRRPFISAVEVLSPTPTRAIITFGDSITDGNSSTVGANRRWPDVLAQRLHAAGMDRSVVNQGISGNQVRGYYTPGTGDAAIARFDRDVLTVPGASWMVMLEGVNDIGIATLAKTSPPDAATIIAGYKQIIARAHAHGLKVYLSTIMPYSGARYYKPEGNTIRLAVNEWIRRAEGFEGVIDFDALMRDPADPTKLKADLQTGDWLHPNDAGYRIMGEAVDLALFR